MDGFSCSKLQYHQYVNHQMHQVEGRDVVIARIKIMDQAQTIDVEHKLDWV